MARYRKLKQAGIVVLVVLLTVMHGLSDSWQQCSAPEGGDISCLASCGPYLFAGTMDKGVMRWSESEGQWEEKNDGIGNLFIHSMAAVDTVLFVGTMGNGLCRTLDYGETWERVWYDRDNWDFTVRTVAVIDNAVFAISRRSDVVVRSRDHGVTWERLSFLQYHNHFVPRRCFAGVSGSIFVGTSGGVLRSSDGGDTWEEASAGLSVPVFQLAAVDSVLVAGTYRGGLFVSHNSGSSWSPSTKGIEEVSNRTVSALASLNGVVYAGIGDKIFFSSDRGFTWEILGDTAEVHYGKALVGYREGVHAADCGGGVLHLDEKSMNWEKLNSGLSAHTVTDLVVSSDVVWATSWYGGLFSLSPTCANSVLEYRTRRSHQCAAIKDEKALYCGTDRGIFRRTFGQTVWEEDNLGIPIPPEDSNLVARVSSMWFDDSLEFAAVSGILYRRSSGSKEWIRSSKDPQGAGGLSHVLFVEGRVLAGGAGLHVSEDTCKTWRSVIAEDGGIKSIIACDSLVLCANFFHGVYYSIDAGSTWEKPNQKLQRVEALSFVGQACFAGTGSQGLFVSHDTARTWVQVTEVPDNVPILSMAVSDSVLYLGTDGRGVWTFDVREMSASAQPVPRSPSKSKYIVPSGREGFDLLGRKLISPKRATSISVEEDRKHLSFP